MKHRRGEKWRYWLGKRRISPQLWMVLRVVRESDSYLSAKEIQEAISRTMYPYISLETVEKHLRFLQASDFLENARTVSASQQPGVRSKTGERPSPGSKVDPKLIQVIFDLDGSMGIATPEIRLPAGRRQGSVQDGTVLSQRHQLELLIADAKISQLEGDLEEAQGYFERMRELISREHPLEQVELYALTAERLVHFDVHWSVELLREAQEIAHRDGVSDRLQRLIGYAEALIPDIGGYALAQLVEHEANRSLVIGTDYKLTAGIAKSRHGKLLSEAHQHFGSCLEIDVSVQAPGMQVRPGASQKVRYVPELGSYPVAFTLCPGETGRKTIMVEFYHQGHWLADLPLTVEAKKSEVQVSGLTLEAVSAVPAVPCQNQPLDLMIRIQQEVGGFSVTVGAFDWWHVGTNQSVERQALADLCSSIQDSLKDLAWNRTEAPSAREKGMQQLDAYCSSANIRSFCQPGCAC